MAKPIYLEKNGEHFEYFVCNLPDDDKKTVSIKNAVVARKSFKNADSVECVSFEKCNKIEEFAFEDCKDLKSVLWKEKEDKTTVSASSAIQTGEIQGIEVPTIHDLTIQHSAFKNCSKLQTVILPIASGKIVIEKEAFLNCYELRTVVLIGDGAFEISDEAFSGCDTEKLVFVCSENSAVEQFARENGYRWINVQ